MHAILCISVHVIAVQQCPDSLPRLALPYLAVAITGTELTATPTMSPFFSSSIDSLSTNQKSQFIKTNQSESSIYQNQPIRKLNLSKPTNQKALSFKTNQLISLPTNHRANLPNYSQTEDYDPPCLANLIVVVTAVTGDNYDCTDIYRRSQRGYRCNYDCTEIYRRSVCRLR